MIKNIIQVCQPQDCRFRCSKYRIPYLSFTLFILNIFLHFIIFDEAMQYFNGHVCFDNFIKYTSRDHTIAWVLPSICSNNDIYFIYHASTRSVHLPEGTNTYKKGALLFCPVISLIYHTSHILFIVRKKSEWRTEWKKRNTLWTHSSKCCIRRVT